MIEIKRDKNYNIEIKDIKFTEEFITKSSKEYLKYLNNIMNDNNIGIKFHKEIDEIQLKNMESNYDILSIKKMKHKEYSNKFLEEFISKSQNHLYIIAFSSRYFQRNWPTEGTRHTVPYHSPVLSLPFLWIPTLSQDKPAPHIT